MESLRAKTPKTSSGISRNISPETRKTDLEICRLTSGMLNPIKQRRSWMRSCRSFRRGPQSSPVWGEAPARLEEAVGVAVVGAQERVLGQGCLAVHAVAEE